MDFYLHLLTSIVVLALVILFIVYIRHIGLLQAEDGKLFSRLVMQLTLPAQIFGAFAHSSIEWEYLVMFLFMFGTEMVLMGIAWSVGRLLQLGRAQMGSFIIVSMFGSSSLLGYALILQLFPDNIAAVTEAAIISELGVGLPLFTIGVMIAIYYGDHQEGDGGVAQGVLLFFRSPIFWSIVIGILWSFSGLGVDGVWLKPLFDAVNIIAKANTFLVALSVGVLLQFSSLRPIIGIAVAVVFIKLILSPLLAYLPTEMMTLQSWQINVLILEAAMPSAMLSVVLADRYGCDAKLASKLVFVTLAASPITMIAILSILG